MAAPVVKSFEDGPAPPYTEDLVAEIRRRCPYVFLICFRDKNRNVVIYEARVKDQKLLDPPVDAYWLLLEPSYQEPRKQKGIPHDREELSYVDHQFAWGFEQRKVSDKEASFSFRAFPHPLTVKLSDQGTTARLFAAKDGKKYVLQQLYVKASEHFNLFKLSDNVRSILVKGMNITRTPYHKDEFYLKGGPES